MERPGLSEFWFSGLPGFGVQDLGFEVRFCEAHRLRPRPFQPLIWGLGFRGSGFRV